MPLVEFGHIHFGENKVQEALDKWQNIKQENKMLNSFNWETSVK